MRLPTLNLLQSNPAGGASSIADVTDDWPSMAQIIETLTFQAGHNTTMVILGTTLLGLAAGIIGVFALLRKRSLMTDALSHATLPGIALAFLFAASFGLDAKSLPVLLVGATTTGVLGVLCIQAILRFSRLREDAAIGIVLSVFFGAGIVGMSYIQANAASRSGGLNHFIYGQAATMQPPDVILMGIIAGLAMLATLLFLKEFSLVCFNDAFAKVDGWPVSVIDLVMMALVVLVTVAGLQAVGLILVVALLIIPPVAARFWTERLWLLVLIAGLIGAASGYLGSSVSALFPRKPAGAVIVLTAGAIFAISMLLAPARGMIAIIIRRTKMRLKVGGDHLLEHAYELHQTSIPRDELRRLAQLRGWTAPFRSMVMLSLRLEGMLKSAAQRGLELTDAGIERGARVSRNHALWEQYLVSYADIAPSHVDWSVDLVEHVLSDELVHELEDQLRSRGVTLPERKGVAS
ncbi:MAG: iron chelate uptake ABC transporter family permease subunit [Phycisphaerales bacterium JB052]